MRWGFVPGAVRVLPDVQGCTITVGAGVEKQSRDEPTNKGELSKRVYVDQIQPPTPCLVAFPDQNNQHYLVLSSPSSSPFSSLARQSSQASPYQLPRAARE